MLYDGQINLPWKQSQTVIQHVHQLENCYEIYNKF